MDDNKVSEAVWGQPPSQDLRVIAKEVIDWAESEFPNRTTETLMAKLQEEMDELSYDLSDETEMADVLIVMVDLARNLNIDLGAAVAKKMEINRKRDWSKRKKP